MLCCPEDYTCQCGWQLCSELCLDCHVPACADCRLCLARNTKSPVSLADDNCSLGRVDAAICAFESQKAEGVLHLHMFLFPQMAHEYLALPEIAGRIREGVLSAEDFKTFVSTARCAQYPDNDLFKTERATIERTWPTFANDLSSSRPPSWACSFKPPSTLTEEEMRAGGMNWNRQNHISRMFSVK